MYFLFFILPVVAGISCRTSRVHARDCTRGCFIEYDKSFMFPVKQNCWNGEVNYNDEYKIFCNSDLCNADNGTERGRIECYGPQKKRCSACYIKISSSGDRERGCHAFSASEIVQTSDYFKEVCNTPHCNEWPYEHKCYSGYFGDCTWYVGSAKIHSPQEENCDRMHMVNQCVNQTLIHERNNGRVCYMYGCHHRNARISVEMLRKKPAAKTKYNIRIVNGFANATQCNGSLCNVPRPPSKLYCFENDGNLTLCPDYTTSCRMYENGDNRKCTSIGRTILGCDGEICDCSGDGCNNIGIKCFELESNTTATCGPNNYCQIVWDLSNQEIVSQECVLGKQTFGCRYDENTTHYTCDCPFNNCNILGDFRCYQSSNDQLGILGPCPINTKTCRTIRDLNTKIVKARSCAPVEFPNYFKETKPEYEDCYGNGCNLWGNSGTVCYDSNATEATVCPGGVLYCQTIWSLWNLKVEIQGCSLPNVSSIGCYYNEDRTLYICNCVGEECNKLGDFQCYQSFNHELGRLGPCPINTTSCRILKDTVTHEIFARSCMPLDSPSETDAGNHQVYDLCDKPGCNNETVHGRWCPVGVKGRCFETWKNYLVPFHDLLPKPCYGFHDQCHTTKINTSSGECTIYTCEFFDYNGNVNSTPAIEDETCYTGPQSTHCVCEGDKCLDDVRNLLDMFMNQANGLHFGISLVGLILILL